MAVLAKGNKFYIYRYFNIFDTAKFNPKQALEKVIAIV